MSVRRLGAMSLATTLGTGVCALSMVLTPSVGRADAPPTPTKAPPLSSSHFVIVEPNGAATAFGGSVTMAPGSGQHQFVFNTVGYVFSFINTSKVLVPGQYSSAVDTLMDMVNDPACHSGLTTGSVQVDQATYDGTGAVTSAAVQFEFSCDSGTYVYGSIAYQLPFPSGHLGYYVSGSDGRLLGFGNASYLSYLGTPTTRALFTDVVGTAATPDGAGYVMAASDGGIFAFGDAGFHGSMGGRPLNEPIVGLAATPDGQGYWEVAADGGIFAFGDAGFHGSMGGRPLNAPIVGILADSSSDGYSLAAVDGGVFSFGDAAFAGSAASALWPLSAVGIAAGGSAAL